MRFCFLLAIIFSFSTFSIANEEGRKITSGVSKIGRKDIYIAIRTDGKPGSGMPGDPFDASTAIKFDTIIDGLRMAGGANHVVLGKGVFETRGSNGQTNAGIVYPDNATIMGAGIDRTVIRQSVEPVAWNVPGAGSKWTVIANSTKGSGGVTLKDLTVDANWQGIPHTNGTNKALLCVQISGSNNTVRNCRFINMYGNAASGNEDFALLFYSTSIGGSNCWAKDCLFESPRGDHNAAIAMFGFDARHPMVRSGVVNCQALGRFESGLVNLAYDSGITVTGCYTYDSRGVYHDTGSLDHLVVTNNVFDRVWGAGVQSIVNNHPVSDVLISGNYFQVINNVACGHSYGVVLTAQSVSKAIITKNVFVKDATGSGYPGWRAIYVSTVNEAVIADNTGDNSMEYKIAGTKVSTRNNRDFDGTALPAFPRQ
jgi:hypothetical protein